MQSFYVRNYATKTLRRFMKKEKKQKDNKYDTSKKTRRTFIGGQALLEGVMMRGQKSVALAVRAPDGEIEVKTERLKPASKASKVPILRGIISFVSSLVVGMKSLLKSAEIAMPDDEAPSKASTTFSVILGVILALGLFVGLPWFCGWAIEKWAHFDSRSTMIIVKSAVEGGSRLVLFVAYLAIVRLMPDIKRTFMYHGAEHRTINCYERGLPLTVENVQSCSTKHNRCGTTFLFFVVIFAILFYALLNWLLSLPAQDWVRNPFFTLALRLCLLPVIAGVSYELLRGLAMMPDNKFTNAIRAPGLVLQKLTTALPDDDMAEVAIAAFNAVLELDADDNKSTIEFYERDFQTERKILKERLKDEPQNADWIYSALLDKPRGELGGVRIIKIGYVKTARGYAEKLEAGEPLDYVLGNTDFCGIKINVDKRVLIPRFETEVLAAEAVKLINAKGDGAKALDICTGSGCIAAYIAKNSGCEVVAADVSEQALEVAGVNLKGLGVKLVRSNMFDNIDEKFDVIVSNPPYVRTADIDGLAPQVTAQPRLALDGGADGLHFYRIIADNAPKFLNDGGAVIVEVGYDQADAVKKLFEPLGACDIIKDFDGVDRIVVCKTKHIGD